MSPAADSVELAEAAAVWRSAYVHIPFCRRICPYCDFAVVAGAESVIDRYVACLIAEVELDAPLGSLDAVFIGGGTPSRLEPDHVRSILQALGSIHGFAEGAEITLEANPEDWTVDISRRFQEAGITRVSLGVQSFDPTVLAALGRLHSPAQAADAVEAALETGFDSVSVDLIFGTAGETAQSWASTTSTAIGLGVDHLSTYALTVERGTPLFKAVAAGAPAPDDDDQADKWEQADTLASGAGLVRYEVSNAARSGRVCRYNLATWAQADYAAYGVGAHGHRAGVRTRNLRRLDAYLDAVEHRRTPVQGTDTLSSWAREQERLMLGLRRRAGVAIGRGGEALLSSEAGQRLVEAGVVEHGSGRLRVARPLLTDMATRAVLELADPASA